MASHSQEAGHFNLDETERKISIAFTVVYIILWFACYIACGSVRFSTSKSHSIGWLVGLVGKILPAGSLAFRNGCNEWQRVATQK